MQNSYEYIKGLLFDLGCEGIQEQDTGALVCIRSAPDVDMQLGFSFEMGGDVLLMTLMLQREKCLPFDEERIEGLQALINYLNNSFAVGRWYYDEEYMPRMDLQLLSGGNPITHRQLAKMLLIVDELARNQAVAVQLWCQADLPLQPTCADLASTTVSALVAHPDKAQAIFAALSLSDEAAALFERLAKGLGADFELPDGAPAKVEASTLVSEPQEKCVLH